MYDAAYLNRGLNRLMSSYDRGHAGSAYVDTYREDGALKGRNAEYGSDNGNRRNGGRNNNAQISRNRNSYTDAHRNRGEADYKRGNVFAKGSRFNAGRVNDYRGRNGQGISGNNNKRQCHHGLLHERGNEYKGRQVRVSIRKEYRNRDRYNGESGIDYGNQNRYKGESRRRYGFEESKHGPEIAYRNFRDSSAVNYNTRIGGKGTQRGIVSASGNSGLKNEHGGRIAFGLNYMGNEGRNRHRIATSDLNKYNNAENKYQIRGTQRGSRYLDIHRSREIRYVANGNRYPHTSKTSHHSAYTPVNSQNVNIFSGRNEQKRAGNLLYRELF